LLSHNDSDPLHLLIEKCDSQLPSLRKLAKIQELKVAFLY
jgi:hypothetical protein